MVDITPIINAIIALIAALVSAFLIPWLKSKVEAGKLAQYKEWVTMEQAAAKRRRNMLLSFWRQRASRSTLTALTT